MAIALFGGSFDPIHLGHIIPIVELISFKKDIKKVIYLPASSSPFKVSKTLTPVSMRISMVELALLDFENLVVSDYDSFRTPAYTIDTVRHYSKICKGEKLYWLLGDDSFKHFTKWRRWRDILDYAELIVLNRSLEKIKISDIYLQKKVTFFRNSKIPVSSTLLRKEFKLGNFFSPFVPDKVIKYIKKYGLYR